MNKRHQPVRCIPLSKRARVVAALTLPAVEIEAAKSRHLFTHIGRGSFEPNLSNSLRFSRLQLILPEFLCPLSIPK